MRRADPGRSARGHALYTVAGVALGSATIERDRTMPPLPATPTWELAGPYGPERWLGQPGAFEQVLLAGERVSLDPMDGELHVLRPRGSNCPHPGPWPFGFGFCPLCGTALPPPPPAREAQPWSSPANAASGLPAACARGTPDPLRRAELAMPGPSRLDFFVAGAPSRLLALDQTTGRLHVWVEGWSDAFEGGGWRALADLPGAADLPRWSWSVAAFADGVAVPGAAGPLWVSLGPRSATVVAAGPAAGLDRAAGGDGAAGGAAGLGSMALVPVSAGGLAGEAGGALAMAFRSPATSGWQRAPVRGASLAGEVFAAPSVNGREAFWVGRHGQLFARLDGAAPVCEWRPWREGWQPMQGVRPVLSPNGVFHQLGLIEGRQAFEALLPPGATPQRRAFGRYVTSCGAASFSGMVRFGEPWEPRRMEYRGEDAFLLPLLAFDAERFLVASCTPRIGLLNFIRTDQIADVALECRISFTTASVAPTFLGVTIRAVSAWEIVPLVHRRSLLVYDLRANRCHRWPLDGDGAGDA